MITFQTAQPYFGIQTAARKPQFGREVGYNLSQPGFALRNAAQWQSLHREAEYRADLLEKDFTLLTSLHIARLVALRLEELLANGASLDSVAAPACIETVENAPSVGGRDSNNNADLSTALPLVVQFWERGDELEPLIPAILAAKRKYASSAPDSSDPWFQTPRLDNNLPYLRALNPENRASAVQERTGELTSALQKVEAGITKRRRELELLVEQEKHIRDAVAEFDAFAQSL